jgi:hypothetical protein
MLSGFTSNLIRVKTHSSHTGSDKTLGSSFAQEKMIGVQAHVARPAIAQIAPVAVCAWIGRNRRLAKDFEATIDSARAFLYAASVMLLARRIARAS